jgi:hypothetical protein
MTTQESTPTYARDIQPLFRARDRASMSRHFDLWDYHDVSTHAQAILGRLSSGTMPCDGKWPEEQIALFRRWVEAGMPALLPFRLTLNGSFQHELTRLVGGPMLRSGLPGLARFDVWFQY